MPKNVERFKDILRLGKGKELFILESAHDHGNICFSAYNRQCNIALVLFTNKFV